MKEQPIYHEPRDNEEKDEKRRRRSQKKKVNMAWRVLKIWGICLAVAAGVLCLFLARKVGTPILAMYVDAEKLVSESSPKTFRSEQTTIIYDSNNEVLKKLKGEKDVYYLSYDQIPDAAKLAIISIEDRRGQGCSFTADPSWKHYDGRQHHHSAAGQKYLFEL